MSDYHTLFLTNKGVTYSCGHGAGGRLGHGVDSVQATPKIIEGLKSVYVVYVAASNHHSIAVTSNGEVFSWGDNGKKCLGMI